MRPDPDSVPLEVNSRVASKLSSKIGVGLIVADPVKFVFSPKHIVEDNGKAVTEAGNGKTVTERETEVTHEFKSVTVYVILAVPDETPVTTPSTTVAIPLLLLLQIPFGVLLENIVVPATHNV